MTAGDVRALAKAELEKFERQNGTMGAQSRWCRQNKITLSSFSRFMHGKVGPSAKLLDHLGLEVQFVLKNERQNWRMCSPP